MKTRRRVIVAVLLAVVGPQLFSATPATAGRLPHVLGRVVDGSGQPVAGVKVYVGGGDPSTVTDSSGKFDVQLRNELDSFDLLHSDGRSQDAVYFQGVVRAPADGTDLNLGDVEFPALIRGTLKVVDSDGDPVAGATIAGTVEFFHGARDQGAIIWSRATFNAYNRFDGSPGTRWDGTDPLYVTELLAEDWDLPGINVQAKDPATGDLYETDMIDSVYSPASRTWTLKMDGLDVDPPAAPPAPTNAVAQPGDGCAHVSWQVGQSYPPITGYTVTAVPDGPVLELDRDVRQMRICGLTNGQAYSFEVVAHSEAGNSSPSLLSAPVTPAAPASAPSRMAAPAVKVRHGMVTFSWKPPAQSGGVPVTSYRVTVSKVGRHLVKAAARSLVLRKLKPGKYTATVQAKNAVGLSPASPKAVFRVPTEERKWAAS